MTLIPSHDKHTPTSCGIVPEDQRTMAMKEAGNCIYINKDSSDVGSGAEGPYQATPSLGAVL